jgi:hypothetical protein
VGQFTTHVISPDERSLLLEGYTAWNEVGHLTSGPHPVQRRKRLRSASVR